MAVRLYQLDSIAAPWHVVPIWCPISFRASSLHCAD